MKLFSENGPFLIWVERMTTPSRPVFGVSCRACLRVVTKEAASRPEASSKALEHMGACEGYPASS